MKLDPKVVHNVIDLLAAAVHIDRNLMDMMDRLDEDFAELNTLAMQIFRQLSKNKHALNDKVLSDKKAPREDVINHLDKFTLHNRQIEVQVNTHESQLQRLYTCCEHSFAFYEDIVKTAVDDAVTLIAQDLALSVRDRVLILELALGK